MEKIRMQMDAKLKFCKNEVYSPHNPITHAGLVQFGWKKKLKVDHPVDISFMSVNCGKNEFSSLKFSNASFAIEPKDCPDKKETINDGGKDNNIIHEKIVSKDMSKKVKKTYKSCDNLTDDENSVEGDNFKIANKIKQGKYGGKNIGKTKRYDKKEKYERYEDLSSDWEEVKDDKGLDKLKEKMTKRYVKEGINSDNISTYAKNRFDKTLEVINTGIGQKVNYTGTGLWVINGITTMYQNELKPKNDEQFLTSVSNGLIYNQLQKAHNAVYDYSQI